MNIWLLPLQTKIMGGVAFAVLSTAGVMIASAKLETRNLRTELEEVATERDSIALDMFAKNAEIEGWSVRFAQMSGSAEALMEERDSISAELVRQLGEAHARIRQFVAATAIATATIRTLAAEQDSTHEVPEWWAGMFNDGLLAADWRFQRVPEPAELVLQDYTTEVPLELVSAEGGDGRWVVTGRSSDPRVQLNFEDVFVDLPEPERVEVTSFWRDLKHVGGGAAGGLLGGLVVCAVGG